MQNDITLPTVHMNGTGKKTLMEGYDGAADALLAFADAFGRIEFNARDYYVQGSDAYPKARDNRDAINLKIREIRDYIDAHREYLYDL